MVGGGWTKGIGLIGMSGTVRWYTREYDTSKTKMLSQGDGYATAGLTDLVVLLARVSFTNRLPNMKTISNSIYAGDRCKRY